MESFRIRPAIVLFGDSLTQFSFGDGEESGQEVGWASLLAASYQRRADVFNRGFSGYNTRHALDILPRVFGPLQDNGILFCTVFLGANDAALKGERQHVPVEEYGENLGKIILSIRERTANSEFPIIVLTPPPVDNEAWKKWREIDYYDRTNDNTRKYGQEAKKVAQKHNVSILDTWELLAGGTDNLFAPHLSDGLHLSTSGNRLIHSGLMDLINNQYKHLAPMEDLVERDGEYGEPGIPPEEKLWDQLC
jgi:lysophospholipase L1-like esterase